MTFPLQIRNRNTCSHTLKFFPKIRYLEAERTLLLYCLQAITDIFESNHRCGGYRSLQASLVMQRVPFS